MSSRFARMCLGVLVVSIVISGCAPQATPTPVVVEKIVKETQVVKETVVVEPTAEPQAEPIVIGLPAILTGSDTYIHGELVIDAATLAVEEINAKGGVLGQPLDLLVMDDAGDPKQGVIVAHAFCDNPAVKAVIGHCYSGVTIPTLPVYSQAGMPIVVHGTNPRITELGFEDNTVQNTPNDLITGQAAADHAKSELGVTSVAVIHNKSMWGEGVAAVFKTRCEEIGVEVTSYQGVDPEDVDFTPVLSKIATENPDAIYFAGYTEQGLLRKQMVGLGIDALWLAAEATSSEYIDITAQDGVGTISATAAPPNYFRPEMRKFAADFEKRFGKPPESWASYFYDMVYVVADAIERAGKVDRSAISAKLREVDIASIIYPEGLQFDEHGRVRRPVTFIYELKPDLEYELVYVWSDVPPYESMSPEDYKALVGD
ncbi:MAG TPA: branched-chain amino acid ABC transporter substrate-binding protein [Anaerolineae bacterium]|nr:branched-chain amino acid ABC transporter substrate-binding protein [Anaerolineae bacterium]